MYPSGIWVTGLGIVIIWLGALTYLTLRNSQFLKRLFPKKGEGFEGKLDEVLAEVERLEEFKRSSLKNLSKVALLRFNPYKDTGGDQSFSLALLDGLGDGLVVTSLHSRAGTRVFAKAVVRGKEEKHEFSDEEREVVLQALGLKKIK